MKGPSTSAVVTLLLAAALLFPGCAGRAAARPRAEPALHWASRHGWREAAIGALRSPATWIPAAGAAGVALGGWDRRISSWAVRNAPVFGSVQDAQNDSNRLRGDVNLLMLATALIPSTEDRPILGRLERASFEEGIAAMATGLSGGLQVATDRQRPDDSGETSFPSSHAARSFATAELGALNVDAMQLPEPAAIGLKTTMFALAGGAGWARIEGGKHFPTDVLAGAALSDFLGGFTHALFLGRAGVQITPPDGRGRDRVFGARFVLRF